MLSDNIMPNNIVDNIIHNTKFPELYYVTNGVSA